MALDNPLSQLGDLNEHSVERFDAGLTKIHSLLDDSGSPIYDSRVGAAMSMLYARYRQQAPHTTSPILIFPSGRARGKQIRNPGDLKLGLKAAPQFFTNAVPRHEWARWQVRLGWILRAVLEQCDWFKKDFENMDIASRCNAFEACLFMIGYDLRCFTTEPFDTICNPEPPNQANTSHWVPSGHPFSKVISLYSNYRDQERNNTPEDFRAWLMSAHNYSKHASHSYCFPFRENEFDLFGCEKTRLDIIVKGGETGLFAALGTNEPYTIGDEHENVCLVDAWIVGRIATLPPSEQTHWVMKYGFAGTKASANTLRSVGRNIGRHFALLDEAGKPTEFYARFFANGMDDLEPRL